MDVLKYNFPQPRGVDMAFSTYDTIPALLEEAKKQGFYNGNTPANDLFNEWFFKGLKAAPEFKKGVDEELAKKAVVYARALMKSFAPKHEAKEAVCALIFNAALEI